MTGSTLSSINLVKDGEFSQTDRKSLLQGEILLCTRDHSAWGGAVTARMYLPIARQLAWVHLTNYPRWVQYFPDLLCSEVLNRGDERNQNSKQLYQVASKAFLFFTAQVEIYVKVFEILYQQVQFQFEKGSFSDFTANLNLQDWGNGTLIIYSVQATPCFPVPSFLIQQAINLELPANLRQMRQVICNS